MNPFDLTGPQFLGFYIVLAITVIVVATMLRSALRLPDDEPTADMLQLDPYAIAYLAGDADLAVNAAIACLVQRDLVKVDAGTRKLSHTGQTPAKLRSMENYVYQGIGSGKTVQEVRDVVAKRCNEIGARLQQTELVCNDARATVGRLLPTLLVLAVAGLGVVRITIGVAHGRNVGYLVVLTIVTVIVGLVGFARRPHRSKRGDRALDQLKEDNSALEATAAQRADALAGEDFALAVGLFGMGVLAGTPLASLRTALLPPPSTSGGSSCSSSSSCGSSCGGGCGGGGCGGCGG